jgi:hypothetical protein
MVIAVVAMVDAAHGIKFDGHVPDRGLKSKQLEKKKR